MHTLLRHTLAYIVLNMPSRAVKVKPIAIMDFILTWGGEQGEGEGGGKEEGRGREGEREMGRGRGCDRPD